MSKKTAIIIGAGPAGLTAAYELLTRTDIHPVVLEASDTYVGGISKTVVYKGNRIDIGGHRFFSKSDRVMDWWLSMLPLKTGAHGDLTVSYQNRTANVQAPNQTVDPTTTDRVMLVRNRLSRIFLASSSFPIRSRCHGIRSENWASGAWPRSGSPTSAAASSPSCPRRASRIFS